MPRKAQWPPKVTRHKSGQARVRIRGTDIYLGPFGSPQAKAAYARLVASGGSSGEAPPRTLAEPTVEEGLARFTAHARTAYDPRGRELGQFALAFKPLHRLYGPTPLADFDALALEAVQEAMATGAWQAEAERERYRQRGLPVGWSKGVVARRVKRIRLAWKGSVEAHLRASFIIACQ